MPQNFRQWVDQMYAELHRMAAYYMRQEGNTVSLSPTVLVHELYLRLPREGEAKVSRTRFLAIAANGMRRALVDQARHAKRVKRGGGRLVRRAVNWEHLCIDNVDHVLAVNEALEELAELDARQASVVEMRFFGGMTVAEVAEHLGVGKRTVESDWTMAKAWLRRWFDTRGDRH